MEAATARSGQRPALRAFWASLDGGQRRTLVMMLTVIAALHVIGFVTLFVFVAPNRYSLGSSGVYTIGIGVTAYTLGMRHAFDADHISAIDNTTRKLMNDGKRPLSVGFWFSLGHSTIVFALAFLISVGVRALDGPIKHDNSTLHQATNSIGTGVSGVFLYIIAALNLVILTGIVKVFREMKRGTFDEQALEEQLQKRGFMNRFFGKLTRAITQPQQMYPIGMLFGLGFDTATEVALLVVAGSAGAAGLPWYAILCLPVLFAAGMSLLDTIDGSFMNFAYGWAFSKPVRKVFLQHDDHRSVGDGRAGDRHRRDRRADRLGGQPLGRVLDLVRAHRHQPARVHHRRDVHRDLGDRAVGVEVRTHRGALERALDRHRDHRIGPASVRPARAPAHPRGARVQGVALYDPENGRIAHRHRVMVFAGAPDLTPEQVLERAYVHARHAGHDIERLTAVHLAPDHDHRAPHTVDVGTGAVVRATQSNVLDAFVVGVPDPRFGQSVAAAVQLVSPSEEINKAVLRDHVGGQLARYKAPRQIVFIESVDRSRAARVRPAAAVGGAAAQRYVLQARRGGRSGSRRARGLELMLATDLRVASTDANFALTGVRRGLIADDGSLARLPRQLSWAT